MRLSPKVILLLAILCGGMAAYLARGWLRAKPPAPVQLAQVPVVVAAQEIPMGQELGPEQLRLAPWPRELVPAGAFSEIQKLQGRVTRVPLFPGEVVLEGKLAPPGSQAGLAGLLPDNKRAVTIRVDEASGVAGFVSPGNRVDVLVSLDRNEYKTDPLTKIVLQNLKVLGTGQEMQPAKPGEKPKVVPTVTLEVTPEEGEKLALAAKEGHLSLALRSWQAPATVATPGARLSGLLQDRGVATAPAAGQATAPGEKLVRIAIIRQNQVEVAQVPPARP